MGPNSHDAAVHASRGDRPRRPRDPRRRRQRRGGAVAGARHRLRQCARQRLERVFPSRGLSRRLQGGTDRRRRRAAYLFARARRDPLRRQRRRSRKRASTAPSIRSASAHGPLASRCSRRMAATPPANSAIIRVVWLRLALSHSRATSGPALMTVPGAKAPVYCTNPIAFAAPLDQGPPLLIDQASSATAFVQLRHYAERGEPLPPGWAVDSAGEPTTDPKAALRGALLAFGGARGANIALMVEVMAAGLAGANWALDAPAFTSGDRSPGAGLLVIAITPALLAPGLSAALETAARPARRAWRSYSRTTRRRDRNRIAGRARCRDRARRGALKRLRSTG